LRVASGGTKGFIFRFTLNERIRNAGLGRYPSVGLARQLNYSAVGKGEFAGRCAIVPQVFGPNEWARLCGPRSTVAQELLGDRLEMPVRKRLV
jgi:hypothetical protein